MPQQAAQAFDDGQAQACAPVVGAAFVQAAEFFKDFALQCLGNAGALVVHLNAQMPTHAAATHHDAPAPAVADGVGDEVLQYAAQQVFVGAHHGAGGHAAQLQALAFGQHAKVVAQHLQQRAQRHVADMHFELAGLHARDIEQAVENGILRGQGAFDAVGRVPPGFIGQVAAQERGEHARGVQGLQQVVHGGGHEAGFGAVGALGLLAGHVQVAGAVGHALFQRIGQRAQFTRGVLVAGDVGVAGHEAAFGQRVAANLQHRAVVLGAFVQMGVAAAQVGQAAFDGFFHRARAQQAPAGVVAQQVGNGAAHLHQVGRVAE